MDTILGIVMNPKLRTPLLVTAESTEVYVHLFDADWTVAGKGYYGSEGDDEASRLSGYPRSHTPDGIERELRGMGYGTSLYTALCLGAHSNHEYHQGEKQRWYISRYGDQGDGISSDSNRSSDADSWWDSARSLGLTERRSFEEEEDGVDLTYDARSSLRGEDIGDGRVVSDVSSAEGSVMKSVAVDLYPWYRALRAKLVVAEMESAFEVHTLDAAWRALQDPEAVDLVVNVEPEWILACDVRGISLAGINLLGVLAQVAGMSEADLAGFRLRWELSLDPSEDIRQLPLSLTRNASRSRAAYRALERATELRTATGWDAYAALP